MLDKLNKLRDHELNKPSLDEMSSSLIHPYSHGIFGYRYSRSGKICQKCEEENTNSQTSLSLDMAWPLEHMQVCVHGRLNYIYIDAQNFEFKIGLNTFEQKNPEISEIFL